MQKMQGKTWHNLSLVLKAAQRHSPVVSRGLELSRAILAIQCCTWRSFKHPGFRAVGFILLPHPLDKLLVRNLSLFCLACEALNLCLAFTAWLSGLEMKLNEMNENGGDIIPFAWLSNMPLHITVFAVSFLAKVYSLIWAKGTTQSWEHLQV